MKRSHLITMLMFLLLTSGCGSPPQPDFDASILTGEPIISGDAEISASSSGRETFEDAKENASPSIQDEEKPQITESSDGSSDGGQLQGVEDEAPQITLVMVGDVLLHVPVEKSALQEDGTYDYDPIFADTRELISAADLALVNQEVILGGKELGVSGYPSFNAPYEIGDDLVQAGFDVICHATNHAMDKGKQGVTNCLDFWEQNYPAIQVLGLHDNPDDPLYVYEKDGMRIAFLNYTYGTNGNPLPSDMPYAVDLLRDQSKVIADVRYAESVADFTVVCPHWGTEYRLTADSSQKKWAQLFLENGVDLVIGTHPHVIEPIELLTDEETGHSMLVYYSLGNFVNWTASSGDGIANRMVGGMATVTLSRGEDGEVVISDYGVTALVSHLTKGRGGVTVKPLSGYNEELAAENEIRKQDSHFSYDYCVDLCDSVWGTLWK